MTTYTILANGIALEVWADDLEAATVTAAVHIASIEGSRTITGKRIREVY